MNEEATPRVPDDVLRVHLNDAWETEYWCGQFFCTPEQLHAAVATVGVMAADVHAHLRLANA
ncbi:MAG: DUF3606 domain-containing protein [Burkholderiaceae bacterium]|nr:DUF3606 domain-containing protein [Burkholderiaceae bacterium]